MISFSVSFADRVSPFIEILGRPFTGSDRTKFNEAGARAAVDAAAQFHSEFNAEGKWRGKRSFGVGGSDFGVDVAKGWDFVGADADGAEIANDAKHYRFKVKGTVGAGGSEPDIIPKRVGALTIPLVREARDRTARDYEIFFRRRLFTLPGRNALFERVSAGGGESAFVRIFGQYKKGQKSTAVRGRRATIKQGQQLRAVYALAKSTKHEPRPDAVPPAEIILNAFEAGWLRSLNNAREGGEIQ